MPALSLSDTGSICGAARTGWNSHAGCAVAVHLSVGVNKATPDGNQLLALFASPVRSAMASPPTPWPEKAVSVPHPDLTPDRGRGDLEPRA